MFLQTCFIGTYGCLPTMQYCMDVFYMSHIGYILFPGIFLSKLSHQAVLTIQCSLDTYIFILVI